MIDLKRLHHAHTLARYQNFALAAKTLSLSQSALTRSIQSLEEQLGYNSLSALEKALNRRLLVLNCLSIAK